MMRRSRTAEHSLSCDHVDDNALAVPGERGLLRFHVMDGTTDPVETLTCAQHGGATDTRAMQRLGRARAGPRTRTVAPKRGYVRTWLRIGPLIQSVERAAEDALAQHPGARLRIVGHS